MNTCIAILEAALVEAMVERDEFESYWILKEAIDKTIVRLEDLIEDELESVMRNEPTGLRGDPS